MTVYSLKWVKHNFPPRFSCFVSTCILSLFFPSFPCSFNVVYEYILFTLFHQVSLLILFPNPCTPLLIHDQKQMRKDLGGKEGREDKVSISFYTQSLPSSLTFECNLCFSSLFSCLNQIQGPSFPCHSRNKNWFTRFMKKSQES